MVSCTIPVILVHRSIILIRRGKITLCTLVATTSNGLGRVICSVLGHHIYLSVSLFFAREACKGKLQLVLVSFFLSFLWLNNNAGSSTNTKYICLIGRHCWTPLKGTTRLTRIQIVPVSSGKPQCLRVRNKRLLEADAEKDFLGNTPCMSRRSSSLNLTQESWSKSTPIWCGYVLA